METTSDHWLTNVERQPISGGSPMNVRRFLVIHYTEGWSAQSSVDFWKTPAAQGANAHIIIDRDGGITQCRAFNRIAGHAGKSFWRDPHNGHPYSGLNACAIGIELANAGNMVRKPDVYPQYGMGNLAVQTIPRISAKHKNGRDSGHWETYSEAQLKSLTELSQFLVKRYNLDDLVGHEDIAPGRKIDPGPAFPMLNLRVACGFTGLPHLLTP